MCWYDHEFAFGSNEVRYMFDTALKKVSEVDRTRARWRVWRTCGSLCRYGFLGQFSRHELISQSEVEEIFQEKEEKVSMLGMKWVSRNRRMLTSYVMPKSHGVRYPERCFEVQTTRVAWAADEINYERKFWGRKDEGEGVPKGTG